MIASAIALAHRVIIAAWTTTVVTDGAYYLAMARAFAEGPFDRALDSFAGIHPLYPWLVALAGAVLGNLETAAYAVSILVASAAIVPLFFLIRAVWDERIALWTCFVYAIHPVLAIETCDVVNTGLFLALVIGSLGFLGLAFTSHRWAWHGLAGLCAGLAYLTRPEGIILGLFFAAAIMLGAVRAPGRSWRRSAGASLAVATFALTAAPYMLWIRSHTGQWHISSRSVVVALEDAVGETAPTAAPNPQTAASPAPPMEAWASRSFLSTVAKKVGAAMHLPILPLLLLGLVFCRRAGAGTGAVALGGAVAVWWTPFIAALGLGIYPLSHRYLLPGVLFLLPFAAAGAAVLWDAAGRAGTRYVALIRGALIAGVAAICLLKSVRPQRADEAAYLDAGRWIKSQPVERPYRVMATRDKLAYYAGGLLVPVPRAGRAPEALESYMELLKASYRAERADFLIVDSDSLKRFPPGFAGELIRNDFEMVSRFPETSRKDLIEVVVYRLK
ncbi:MAG: glycosyltransferase family 39 protein [Planctomycetes bacterium]|nr:glycosyltransferase family 39 protein [Planctomycetota bacterium]